MNILVKRTYKKDNYTIGDLYIDGEWFCNTLEDKDRNLTSDMDEEDIKKIKVYGETAIPTGTYKLVTNVVSPKFSSYEFYKSVCNGCVPKLLSVKGFDGILIHVADGYKGAQLVQGCLGIGYNKIKGGLLDGKEVFKQFWNKIKDEKEILITICH